MTPIPSTKVLRQGQGLAQALLRRAPVLPLPWAVRSSTHFSATDSEGREITATLPPGPPLRDGDVLVAQDGTLLRVAAAPQPLMQVSLHAGHGQPTDLAQAAYQLARRGQAVQFAPDHLLAEPDLHAQALLQQMQLRVQEHEAPFEPAGTQALAQYVAVASAPRSLMGSYRRPAAAPVPPTAGVPA
jgi:urease accessory protein